MIPLNKPARCADRWSILAALVLAMSASGASAAEVYIGLPHVGAYRVDICYEWGMQCSGEAADMWCKSQGYTRALEWEIDHDIGAQNPTMVIGSGQVCNEAHCDGYFSISCAWEDAWTQSTGQGGLLVEVNLNSQQSPEGLLIIAVSEKDPTQAASGVVGINNRALLHAAAGKWRIFVLNFNNPQPIRPQPGEPIEIQAGKDGAYLAMMVD
jgi:hypothetical protein